MSKFHEPQRKWKIIHSLQSEDVQIHHNVGSAMMIVMRPGSNGMACSNHERNSLGFESCMGVAGVLKVVGGLRETLNCNCGAIAGWQRPSRMYRSQPN